MSLTMMMTVRRFPRHYSSALVVPKWRRTQLFTQHNSVAAFSSDTTKNRDNNSITTSSTPNALDQAIVQLADLGASHLPQVFQALMQSNVYYLTQSPQHTSVKDALTLPSSDKSLHPAIFSSPWSAQRYMAQHNLAAVLDQATTNEIAARDFLQQTRPATVLLNPPVFTLTPEMIDSLLLSSETEKQELATHSRTRLEPLFASTQYRAAKKSSSRQVIKAIHDVLTNQDVIIAAYMMEYECTEDAGSATVTSTPQQALACLCRITHIDEFERVEKELLKALEPHDKHIVTLCLNLVPDMDVLGFAVDRLVPLFLDLGNMSDFDFTLYADKLAVGPAPPLSPRDRQTMLGKIVERQAKAAYQVVYQVASYTPQVGTFYQAADESCTDDHASLQECLHRQWGYLHELPPEMVDYIRENIPPIYERQES
jgi:hypothetical protein